MTILPTSCEPMQIKVKGFKVFKDRHGRLRCYHRATGTSIDLNQYPFGSVEFLGECGRIAALSAPEGKPKPGSLGLLIKEYKTSPQWQDLAPKTREWYEMGFDYLRPINDTPLIRFKPSLVVKIRDKALKKKSWYFANLVKTSLSTVFSWGAERDYMELNPCKQVKKIKRPKDLAKLNMPWKDHERFIALKEAPEHFRLNLGIMMYLGLDPCDTVALRKNQAAKGMLNSTRQKTGNVVSKSLPLELQRIMDKAPKHNATTVCANSYGEPWTKSGQDSVWQKLRERLEKEGTIREGLTLKGLRHTHATLLREQGEDYSTIADSLAQDTEAMARHYSEDADVSGKLKKATQKFNRIEAQKIAKFVKPSKKSVKP